MDPTYMPTNEEAHEFWSAYREAVAVERQLDDRVRGAGQTGAPSRPFVIGAVPWAQLPPAARAAGQADALASRQRLSEMLIEIGATATTSPLPEAIALATRLGAVLDDVRATCYPYYSSTPSRMQTTAIAAQREPDPPLPRWIVRDMEDTNYGDL